MYKRNYAYNETHIVRFIQFMISIQKENYAVAIDQTAND